MNDLTDDIGKVDGQHREALKWFCTGYTASGKQTVASVIMYVA